MENRYEPLVLEASDGTKRRYSLFLILKFV
jgi:hypothetical protein